MVFGVWGLNSEALWCGQRSAAYRDPIGLCGQARSGGHRRGRWRPTDHRPSSARVCAPMDRANSRTLDYPRGADQCPIPVSGS